MTAYYPGQPPVDAYGNGGFRFAGMSHRGSILLMPSGVYDWCADPLALTPADFAAVFRERGSIDLLLFGTGPVMVRPPAAVRETFAASGIQMDYMATGFAVSTYNLLLAERRKVAAALVAVAIAG